MWKPQTISVKDVGQINSGGGVLLAERPNQAAKIGAIIACWSLIEYHFTHIIAHVVNAEDWIAAEMLADVRKFQARHAIVIKNIERRFDAAFCTAAKTVLRWTNLKDMQNARDCLAHGTFITINKYPDSVVLVRGYGSNEQHTLYTDDGLKEIHAHFVEQEAAIHHLLWTIIASVPPKDRKGQIVFPHHTWMAVPTPPPSVDLSNNQPQPEPSQGQSGPEEPSS